MKIIGANILYFEELESTNSYALNLIKEDKPIEGTVIVAKNQTQGRGQRGNNWISSPLNLSFSLLLYPKFLTVQEQFSLNKAIALAIREALEILIDKKVQVKWPNDIYVGNKKIAGILIENSIRSKTLESSVVGIGLNVNQTDFPEELKSATSMKLETGKDFDNSVVLETICDFINARYIKFFNNSHHKLDHEYLEHLYQYGEYYPYSYLGKEVKAKILAVSKDGNLLLKDLDGNAISCGIKELLFL